MRNRYHARVRQHGPISVKTIKEGGQTLSEQWKADGKCEDCRRKDYCKTQCTANKRMIRARVARLIQEYYDQMTKKEKGETENAESDQTQNNDVQA